MKYLPQKTRAETRSDWTTGSPEARNRKVVDLKRFSLLASMPWFNTMPGYTQDSRLGRPMVLWTIREHAAPGESSVRTQLVRP